MSLYMYREEYFGFNDTRFKTSPLDYLSIVVNHTVVRFKLDHILKCVVEEFNDIVNISIPFTMHNAVEYIKISCNKDTLSYIRNGMPFIVTHISYFGTKNLSLKRFRYNRLDSMVTKSRVILELHPIQQTNNTQIIYSPAILLEAISPIQSNKNLEKDE